jgi:hypothetical protein
MNARDFAMENNKKRRIASHVKKGFTECFVFDTVGFDEQNVGIVFIFGRNFGPRGKCFRAMEAEATVEKTKNGNAFGFRENVVTVCKSEVPTEREKEKKHKVGG